MESIEYKGTRVEIDLDNLAFNMKEIRNLVSKETMIMAVVKGNAYGHGSVDASKVFLENGADRLAVSIYQEGIELRNAGIKVAILILNYTPHSQYEKAIKSDLILSIYNYEDAKLLSEIAGRINKKVKVHIKIDTGMGRIGFLPNEEGIKDIIKIAQLPYIEIEGIYSHFASADEGSKDFTKEQYKRFNRVIKELNVNNINIPIKHVSNSAAIIDTPEYNLDMVRPGIILYGYYPSSEIDKSKIKLKPAMTLKTNISHLKILPQSTGIGYNQMFITKRDSKIATLPIGYADGYYRLLTGRGQVFINNMKVPIVGRICMDQMMVDVTDIKNVNIGDEVVLFGYKDSRYPQIKEISKLLGTTFYEVITLVSRRVPRMYMIKGRYSHMINYLLD